MLPGRLLAGAMVAHIQQDLPRAQQARALLPLALHGHLLLLLPGQPLPGLWGRTTSRPPSLSPALSMLRVQPRAHQTSSPWAWTITLLQLPSFRAAG
ncbi:hypothetical protein GGTG_03668 [Gaeumannomyces tritici R3-111a-1]|uniref:Uncharacterized protein n=1 Tax=Gaeumannomyces tritici (strain R3-111a-1) TaxID=644352 RepID=J3NQW2_GAET3|nr:hypothetical protein GGTG_03668 [Gaeumannomyces tritici R3-111a-1]EJT78568.1 hypothetical protein GGTG_03668 [Gaeumannomyces tritici R3-111a-1]